MSFGSSNRNVTEQMIETKIMAMIFISKKLFAKCCGYEKNQVAILIDIKGKAWKKKNHLKKTPRPCPRDSQNTDHINDTRET